MVWMINIFLIFVFYNAMTASYKKYELIFKRASGTSRGILTTKETYFIKIEDDGMFGIGECAVFRGLSSDDVPHYEELMQWTCSNIHLGLKELLKRLKDFPSIQFGLEQAFLSLKSKDPFELFPSEFTQNGAGIPINGLVWMGDKKFMKSQIEEKLKAGFSTIKMKIGAIDFKAELELLKSIRMEFSVEDITLRVDANGAFTPENALEKLKRLSEFDIHSIEQPIRQGQFEAMAQLCAQTPLDIALDEELIGINDVTKKRELLQMIKPQFIILKPSLVGGIEGSEEWIQFSKQQGIDYWITSALESNIGLNAIAQWTYTLNSELPQGLGTGSLFTNNIESPLKVEKGKLYYKSEDWNFNIL